ncbi:hypothetical protein N7481_003843 [Penicillium waksmanii]|uniref:uncharacterized protein n=1 Tax=Penicillium waksmanii TaxID=69791 RepID=UPI0025475DC7|nr:uncharacterized protein N7481_003843 [Penicillium waksmanii]KAJ5988633.1 hypothetical protein N7481_003843 [Penicillium waksmanii]
MPKRYCSQVSKISDEMDFELILSGHPRQKRLKRVSSSPLPITHNSSSEDITTESKRRDSSDGNVFASLSQRLRTDEGEVGQAACLERETPEYDRIAALLPPVFAEHDAYVVG